jgi:hypothetical protein
MNKDLNPNPEKPTEQWVTGREPMTGPQISYLQTLRPRLRRPISGTLSQDSRAFPEDKKATSTTPGSSEYRSHRD